VLRAARAAEQVGIPAATIVSTGFLRQAASTARALGIEGTCVVEYPGVIPMDTTPQLEDKIVGPVLSAILEGLGQAKAAAAEATTDPQARDIVVAGTLDEVLDHFHERQWSDGLPFVPPTINRVEAFLAHTARSPDEVIGVLPIELRHATVWSVAVNGVMAGCRPEYFPILLAIVDAIADPEFRLEDAGSTPGWEPLVVVSGPVVERFGFNFESGALRVGRQANASIGRFLRLFLRNVAGFLPPPGSTDKGSIGTTFNVALAENDAATRALGWDPLRVELGHGLDDDVVMVQSVVAISPPIYSGGDDPLGVIGPITYYLGTTPGPWAFTGVWYGRLHPLLVMSPAVAKAFVDAGWGKREIREHLFEHTTISARWFEEYPVHVAGQTRQLARLVADGLADPSYAASDDPDRLVRQLQRAESTNIVVAGDPGRNQSRIYANNHEQGPPTARRIVWPS
jgi:hypothetical protein